MGNMVRRSDVARLQAVPVSALIEAYVALEAMTLQRRSFGFEPRSDAELAALHTLVAARPSGAWRLPFA